MTDENERENDQADGPATDGAAAGPTHAEVPADCVTECPREDNINLTGYYRRAEGDAGDTIIVTLPACEADIAAYTAKGFTFEGYKPE